MLDIGSGGGIDTILAARRVGPQGRAIGLDVLEEMCERGRGHAAQAGVESWTGFLQASSPRRWQAIRAPGLGEWRVRWRSVSSPANSRGQGSPTSGVGGHQPFGIDQAALYPLFTPELIQVMRRTIPADHQDHVATGVIVKARKPG